MLLAAATQRSRLNLVSASEEISRGPRQISREAGASWQDPCGVISPANWGERAARLPETQRQHCPAEEGTPVGLVPRCASCRA